MPTTSKAPLNFEPLRTMGLLLTAFGLVVSVYVALAVANLFRDMSVWHVVLIGALVLGAQYLFYYLAACAEPIAGVRDKRPESRPDVTPPVGRP